VVNRIRSDSNRTQSVQQSELAEDAEFINHAIESQGRVAQLPPVMVSLNADQSRSKVLTWESQSKIVDPHPLCGLAFEQDCIITSCLEGEQLERTQAGLRTTR
jgi:catabolite repression protein CreC